VDLQNPFGYPIKQYVTVLIVACAGGLVKHINSAKRISVAKFVVDIITSGFTGVLTFWVCESANIHGPMSAILIATGGLMGNKAFKEFEAILKAKLGIASTDKKEANK
jgi:hypothetical protein